MKETCACKIPKPSLKNSENGIFAYCLKCIKEYKPNMKEKYMKEKLQQELDQIEGKLYELQLCGNNDEKLVDRRRELQKLLRDE